MPVTNTPITTEGESEDATLARLRSLVKGELKSDPPIGNYATVIKTAVIYDNPQTGKSSYRCDVEISEGPYAGCSLLVFTSSRDLGRLSDLAKVLGLTDDLSLAMLLRKDPTILRAMQGKAAGVARVAKDPAKPTADLTNNWIVPA
jgi:hypothetical protein